jgi:uncharacterized protein YecE (DUF72 family)
MRVWAGTSGYSFPAWKGSFYPEDLPAKGMLRYFGERLRAVEINNTFYRLPQPSVVQGWAEQVPEQFRFAVKASQKITHFKRLSGVEQETAYLLRAIEPLAARLGPLLVQLPPNFKRDDGRLAAFLGLLRELSPTTRAAFEFRHPSWHDEAIGTLVRDAGGVVCGADTDELPLEELTPGASWGYLRLRRERYEEGDLKRWRDRLLRSDWREAFVFFKHEDEGLGPRLAAQFQRSFTL